MLFRAELEDYPGYYLAEEDPAVMNVWGTEKAAVIDDRSQWGRYLVENPDFCGIKIRYLPEDQQMRAAGQPELQFLDDCANDPK